MTTHSPIHLPAARRMIGAVAALGVAALAASCGTDDASNGALTNVPVGDSGRITVTDDILVLPDGWYELDGYGTVLHAHGDLLTPHYLTTSTCTVGDDVDNALPVDHASGDGVITVDHASGDGVITVDHASGDGVITVDLVGPSTDYRLLPLVDGPRCPSSPIDSITAVGELFGTHYPFFAERNVSWSDELEAIQAATRSDPDGFAPALGDFLVRLGDGHTTLAGMELDPDPAAFGMADIRTVGDVAALIEDEVAATMGRIADPQVDDTGTVVWGGVGPDTGYLLLTSFHGLDGDDDPVADREALRHALDTAIADLDAHFDHLVVDLRVNPGGHEDLAVLTAGYFTDTPAPAYRKWAHASPDPIPQTVEVMPAGFVFSGDVAVLVSPLTASAAEVCLLALRAATPATLVGAPSFGEFSDAIDWVLPDGTELTVSMEVYTDLSGTNHEVTGVPVDVAAAFDNSLAVAVELLEATA